MNLSFHCEGTCKHVLAINTSLTCWCPDLIKLFLFLLANFFFFVCFFIILFIFNCSDLFNLKQLTIIKCKFDVHKVLKNSLNNCIVWLINYYMFIFWYPCSDTIFFSEIFFFICCKSPGHLGLLQYFLYKLKISC